MKDILIVTNSKSDEHADEIQAMIPDRVIRLNTDEYLNGSDISFDTETGFALKQGRRIVPLQEIRSVWLRRPEPFLPPLDVALEEQAFVLGEMDQLFFALLYDLDTFWMSHPAAMRSASLKLEQLMRAKRFGFRVPRTIVPTSEGEITQFFDDVSGQVVYKTLSDPALGLQRAQSKQFTLTTAISPTQLTPDFAVSALLTPNQFQEFIPKRLELRVTVIGSEVFTVELHSQEIESARIDWRANPFDFTYKIGTLPEDVEKRCVEFVHSYGLSYGALDLIQTPEGEYVFLENNPGGQFLWLQIILPELRLKEALIATLERGTNG